MREIVIEMPFPMSAEAFWALRMDRSFDEYCARLDKQVFHPEADNLSEDSEGLVFVQQRCRLQMKENPVPKSVRGMLGSGDDFSYRVHYSFHRDRSTAYKCPWLAAAHAAAHRSGSPPALSRAALWARGAAWLPKRGVGVALLPARVADAAAVGFDASRRR